MTRAELRPLLVSYTDEELDQLVVAGQERRFDKGALLCEEGTCGESCFIVVRGEVEIVKAIASGSRSLATLQAGALVGQMALVDRAVRSASVRARTDTVVLELHRDVFEKLLDACDPLALRFQEQIAVAGIRQLRAAIERLTLLVGRDLPPLATRTQDKAVTELVLELAKVQAAVSEWDISLEDIEKAAVARPRR